MKTPLDSDFDKAYNVFHKDHNHLREDLMNSLPADSRPNRQSGLKNLARIFFGGSTVKIRMTKIAAAAVVIIAAIAGIRSFNGTSAWAEVIKAFNDTDNIHFIVKRTYSNGHIDVMKAWLKNKTMLRDEGIDEIKIDNGQGCLVLNIENKTAQLSDSKLPFENHMESGLFEIILLFRGEKTPYTATELHDERTDIQRVYKVTYRDIGEGKAWVDAKSNLPMRMILTSTEEYKRIVKDERQILSLEVTYDYQPIPNEIFNLDIPPGYSLLPPVQPCFISGKIIDEKGKPVVDAEIVTSDEDIKGTTDNHGQFAIKLPPGRYIGGFPKIIRAVINDDPNRVAWTLLRNPRHELRPLFTPDDGKTKLEQGDVDIKLYDEMKLREFIPDNPGRMIFKSDEDKYPSEVKDIELRIQPASVITGQVTDQGGRSVENAIVWMDFMEISVGENEIWVHDLGQTDKEREILSSLNPEDSDQINHKVFSVTDEKGRYKIGNLPDIWYRVRLEVKADGYVTVAKEIFQNEGNDFTLTRADITIRGTIIDNLGEPLVGREVGIDVESEDDSDDEVDFNVEEVVIDSQGRFELKGVPAVDGLVLEVRADEKPYYWEENELTRGRDFIHYLMVEEPVKLEPGKKEYFVKIVPHRPDITLEVEVKDSKGNPLSGVPAGVCSPGFSEREWYISKLVDKTDVNGVCTITEVPRIEPLRLWICVPETRIFQDWESMRELNPELKDAINESRSKYLPTVVTVKLEKDKKNYKVPVTLDGN